MNERTFRKSTLRKLRRDDWDRLSVLLSGEKKLMPHEVGNEAAIDYATARALLLALAANGLAENYILVYHTCVESFVDARPWDDGLPQLPWVCPECGDRVTDPDELSYDLMSRIHGPINFI
jgi:hypothetical protein